MVPILAEAALSARGGVQPSPNPIAEIDGADHIKSLGQSHSCTVTSFPFRARLWVAYPTSRLLAMAKYWLYSLFSLGDRLGNFGPKGPVALGYRLCTIVDTWKQGWASCRICQDLWAPDSVWLAWHLANQ